ncbi:MAG: hypothetical protein E7812_14325 [Phenylobacterium sp.]|nr:MAG: hypothetical protein E7812_14325 [Phenylobacterium sp.]
MNLEAEYAERFEKVLQPLSVALEDHLRDLLRGIERIDRIQARSKSVPRFLGKAAKTDDGKPKYSDPLHQIQDQIGARVICFYLDDVERVSAHLEKYLKNVEKRRVVPESDSEFGYFGKHYVQFIPSDVIDDSWDKKLIPDFFELQIKTLFQHAWSEADHDLGYKPGGAELASDQKRKIAFTSAQAWGADLLFNELFIERNIAQVRGTI